MPFFDKIYFGNTLGGWLLAIGVTGGSLFVMELVRRLVARSPSILVKPAKIRIDDMVVATVGKSRMLFLLCIAIFLGTRHLQLPATLDRFIKIVFIIAAFAQVGVWLNAALSVWFTRSVERKLKEDAASTSAFLALGFVIRAVVWSVLVLMALENLGVKITTLVAGLGIGGIAVALAIQRILGDLFASLSIVLDKPFVLGDFIIIDDHMGTVEHIGLKTTRIRSLSGEQIVISNSDLLGSRIHNYKRMYERRVQFSIGVTYETPYEKLAGISALLKEAVESQSRTRFDRAHFKQYGESSLDFETVYYVLSPDQNTYMDIQQAINLALYRRFEQEGIRFAHPVRDLNVQIAEGDHDPRDRGTIEGWADGARQIVPGPHSTGSSG